MELMLERVDRAEMDCGRELNLDGGCSSMSLPALKVEGGFSETDGDLVWRSEALPAAAAGAAAAAGVPLLALK
jgi:hypothetical protein